MKKSCCCKKAGAIIGGTLGLTAVGAGIYMSRVMAKANQEFNEKCDYLLILGGNIIGADTPSPQLFERMKRAAVYLNENPETVAIPCGGCFREGQEKSEAQVIADYLIENGVDESRIHLEDKSTTTNENFLFGLQIIEELANTSREYISIGFLSSSYHIHRASLMAQINGVPNINRVTAPTPGEAYKRYFRELAVAPELIKLYAKKMFDK